MVSRADRACCADTSGLQQGEGEINRQSSSYDRTLDRIRTGAAVFDRERRLTFFNEAYRKLWGLPFSGIAALLRKMVSNELLLGYLGEVQFYAWARSRLNMATAPFGA